MNNAKLLILKMSKEKQSLPLTTFSKEAEAPLLLLKRITAQEENWGPRYTAQKTERELMPRSE